MPAFRPLRFLAPALLAAAFLAKALPAAAPVRAALTVPAVFGSGMVLQSGLPVPVWGSAATGDTVTVEFAGQRKTAVADAAGKWRIVLDPMDASAISRPLTISTKKGDKQEKKEFADVLVGEVWIGSGQSNMAIPASGFVKQDPVFATDAAGSYPLLRLSGGAGKGGWTTATSNSIATFSALHFAFGVRLQRELGVPVGLIVGAVGGTPSAYWLSEGAYLSDPGCKAELEKAAAAFDAAAFDAAFALKMSTWSQAVARARQEGKTDFNAPRPPLKPGETAARIGNLYDSRIGPFLGYAIRGVLWDQGESGTGVGSLSQGTLMNALVNGWRKEWGQGDFPFLAVQKPSGGGCAFDPADPATSQADPFAPLPSQVPAGGHSREEYLRVGRLPGVFLVASSDLGGGTHPVCKSGYGARAARVALGAVYGRPVEFAGPVFKSFTVEGGKVRIAFDHVGKGLAIPERTASSTNTAAAGLQGFAVAGTNRVFYWARAAVEGDTVTLESDRVPQPVAIRYAWADRHPWANLFNKDGLPALPFRTDDWPN